MRIRPRVPDSFSPVEGRGVPSAPSPDVRKLLG